MERKSAGRLKLPRSIHLVCLVLLASACAQPFSSQPYPEYTSTPEPMSTPEATLRTVVQVDYIQTTDTYKEIIQKADIIITGKVIDTGLTFNSSALG